METHNNPLQGDPGTPSFDEVTLGKLIKAYPHIVAEFKNINRRLDDIERKLRQNDGGRDPFI